MWLKRAANRLLREEDGSFLSTAVFLAIIAAIIVIAVIDGGRCLSAKHEAADAAQGAAEAAFHDFGIYKNLNHAEEVAAEYCESQNTDYISFNKNLYEGNTFDVTCGKQADTYVFKRIPVLKELIDQEETKTSTGTS